MANYFCLKKLKRRGRERVKLMIKSHGKVTYCHGKVMEKSWKFIIRFLWEPCLMHLLVYLDCYQIALYLSLLYVSVYLIVYFQQFKWFLINLLLAICILRYALLLDVLIDICFVFTMYLIDLADTNRRYSGFCF